MEINDGMAEFSSLIDVADTLDRMSQLWYTIQACKKSGYLTAAEESLNRYKDLRKLLSETIIELQNNMD